MKKLYEQLDELIDAIKYLRAAGHEGNYFDDEYFEDVIEACKEIVEYTK